MSLPWHRDVSQLMSSQVGHLQVATQVQLAAGCNTKYSHLTTASVHTHTHTHTLTHTHTHTHTQTRGCRHTHTQTRGHRHTHTRTRTACGIRSKEQTCCTISPMWRRIGHAECQGNTKSSLTQWCKGLAMRFLCRGRVGCRILRPCYKIKNLLRGATNLLHTTINPLLTQSNLLHNTVNLLLIQSTCYTAQLINLLHNS